MWGGGAVYENCLKFFKVAPLDLASVRDFWVIHFYLEGKILFPRYVGSGSEVVQ